MDTLVRAGAVVTGFPLLFSPAHVSLVLMSLVMPHGSAPLKVWSHAYTYHLALALFVVISMLHMCEVT